MYNETLIMDEILSFGFFLHRAAYLVDQLTRKTLLDEVGVSLPYFLILDLLDILASPVNQQMLADKLVITKGAISKQLDVMQRQGLIARQPAVYSKKDSVVITLPKGRKKLDEARKALVNAATPIANHLGTDFSSSIQYLRDICLCLDPNEQVY